LSTTSTPRRLLKLASMVLLDRKAFLATAAFVFAVKLSLSAAAPASADLGLMLLQDTSIGGPWISAVNTIVNACESVTRLSANLWVQSPPSFSSGTTIFGVLVRLPTLVFDLGVASALYYLAKQIGASTQGARLTCLVWLVNPYTTFAVEMIGTPDIAASFMTVIMALFLLRKKVVYAGLALAVGTALKLFPIFLLPPVLAYLERTQTALRARVFFVAVSLLGLFAYLDWIFQGNFANTRLLLEYTPVTQPITSLLTLGTEIGISVSAVILVVIYYTTWFFEKNHKMPVIDSIIVVLLVYYAFSSLYPQYLLWALPFLTLDVSVRRKHLGLLVLVLTFMFGWGFLYFGGYVTYSGYSLLFFPLQGAQLPWYSEMIAAFLANPATPVLIPSFFRAALSAVMLVYASTYFGNCFRSTAS
jgi:hypothetical protein